MGQNKEMLSGYLPTLDGWRAVAILLVLFYHAGDSLHRAWGAGIEWLLPWLHLGSTGVSIFFGISGFLITSRLLEEQAVRKRIDLGKFYLRRAFRILPPILALVAVLSILSACFHLAVPWGDRVRALCFASNYGPPLDWFLAHTWSLSVEEHFYLLWPLILTWLGCIRSAQFALVVSAAVTVWRVADMHYSLVPVYVGYSSWRTDTTVDYLLLGAAMGCLAGKPETQRTLKSLLAPPVTLLVVSAFIVVIGLRMEFPHAQYFLRVGEAVLIPVFLAGTVIFPRQILGRVLEWSWLRWIGRLSYGLYIWQQLFLVPDPERNLSFGFLQDWPLNLVAVLVCAVLSYYLLERPLIKLGHRLARPVSEGHADLAKT